MKINHTNGSTTDTDKLIDSDAFLLEETKKLFDNYVKYGRQLFLVGELNVVNNIRGTTFFNMSNKDEDSKISLEKYRKYVNMINNSIIQVTLNEFCLIHNPPKKD